MYTLEKVVNISSAHHLPDSDSLVTKKCCNEHGHNYKITVKISRAKLKDGMVIDFRWV
jgi:6-pyruvoyl-tetrahydropterin synthase